MTAGFLAQFGAAKESTWGTSVTPTRFFEFNGEPLTLDTPRIESKGLRAATRVQRSDRWAVNRKGAKGSGLVMEVQSKGFGFWLEHLLGAVATTGPTDLSYVHTGTIASLTGKSFTAQVGKPRTDGTIQPFTYPGCKIPSWELSDTVDGILQLSIDLDAKDEDTVTALAAASYPSTSELLTAVGGLISVGGSNVDVTDVSIKVDNSLNTTRYFQRQSSLKKEQIENGWRSIDFSMTAEFDSMTAYNRFASATASGAVAQLIATWQAPTLIGTTTYPKLVATCTAARFDGQGPVVQGPDIVMQKLVGKALFDGTNSALSLAYTTADTTP